MATAQTDLAVDSGITLQKRVLSTPEVLAQSVANMAPSAAMALLPLFVFLDAGNGAWLSFGISIVILLVVAYCAAQFATRINSAGSFYVWVTRALGPGAGSAAGWGLVLGYLFTGIACVLGFEIYGDNLLVGFGLSPGNHVVRGILYVVGGLAPAIMAVSDIKISQRVAFILEAVSVTIILILCIAVYVHNGGVIDTHQLSLAGAKPGGIVVGMVLAIFAFVGFESAGALGQEAKNPAKSVPRAIIWSCGIIGVFYLIVVYAHSAPPASARRPPRCRSSPPSSASASSATSSRSALPARCSPVHWPASPRARECCCPWGTTACCPRSSRTPPGTPTRPPSRSGRWRSR
jgi:amino acid transporter